jgi:hypothetical protein
MKQIPFLLFALLLLASGAGCIGSWDTDTPKNVTSAPVIHYERGNVSIPINVSGIPVRGFDANATEVIEIVLADPRPGSCLRAAGRTFRSGREWLEAAEGLVDLSPCCSRARCLSCQGLALRPAVQN